MKSLKYIIGIVSMLAITTVSIAQDKTLLQTEVMAKQLGLTDKQKEDLDKELKASRAEREEMQKKLKAFHEEIKRDAFLKREARDEKLKSILSEEQYAKFQEMRKKNVVRQRMNKQGQKRPQIYGRQQGQRGNQQGRVRQQFQQREMAQRRFMQMLGDTPEERQAMMKKFQEFLKQEKEKKEGN